MPDHDIRFSSTLWIWQGEASWHFVTLPEDKASEVRFFTQMEAGAKPRGFGSVRVDVHADEVTWKTSLFPDKKSGSYLLPIKADIRKRLDWSVGEDRELCLWLTLP